MKDCNDQRGQMIHCLLVWCMKLVIQCGLLCLSKDVKKRDRVQLGKLIRCAPPANPITFPKFCSCQFTIPSNWPIVLHEEEEDGAEMRQADAARAAGATICCLSGLWCLQCTNVAAPCNANTLVQASVRLML